MLTRSPLVPRLCPSPLATARLVGLAGVALLAAACATSAPDPLVSRETLRLHQSLLTLDTHLDTPAFFATARGYDILDRHDVNRDGSQVDVPRMREGGLDGGFWVIYTPQGPLTAEGFARARDTAVMRSVYIHEMAKANPDIFVFATTAEDAQRAYAEGKKVVFQSIENSYPLGEDLTLLETFHKLGVRMAGPVHNGNNQFADSSIDAGGPKWGGLSPLGREWVKEANRLGIVIDGSHSSDQTLSQLIDLSATPVILSHSGTSAIYKHPRNIPDELLVKLAAKGGVIQMNALGRFLADLPAAPQRMAAVAALRQKWGNPDDLPADQHERYLDELSTLNTDYAEPQASFEDFMKQFLHALKVVGPDHVGVGADWDGGGGVAGMRDVSALPRITQRLLDEGYSRADIEKIWSGNTLRLVKAAQDHASALKAAAK
jgi:membrane dipeptidase